MQPKLRIFISYAREDDAIKSLFIREFESTADGRGWQVWDDSKILVGDKWDKNIKTNLASADVVVFFYSSDFMNSDYISNVEFKEALQKYESGNCLLVTFRITSSRIDKTNPLRTFQYVDLYSPDNPALLKRMPTTLQKAKNEQQKRDVINFGIEEIIPSLEAFVQKKTEGGASGPIPDAITHLDPNALVVSIFNCERVMVVPPKATQSMQHSLDKQGLPRKAVRILHRLLVEGDLEDEDCQVLGEALFYLLFPTQAAQRDFLDVYSKFDPPKGSVPLKIILHFDQGSDALAGLPWEYLWLPLPEGDKEGFFIGSKNNWVLARRLHTSADKGKDVPIEKLRILVVISKPPQPTEAKGIDDDADFIIKKCQASKDWEKDKIDFAPKIIVSTSKGLRDFIEKEPPFHIVHFIGKGKTTDKNAQNTAERNLIAFCDPDSGKEEWLTPEEFVACFDAPGGDNKRPNLLFLHPIRDTPDACVSLRKAALELVNSVDGVLAIQTPVNSEEAAEFSESLYIALGKGVDLDVAISEAARKMAENKVKHLRMYGISASFSRQTLKLEIAGPVSPILQAELTFLRCPKYDDPHSKCGGLIGVENGRPTRLRCPSCKSGPIWTCPSCKNLVVLTHEEELCPRCDYPMAQIMKDAPQHILDIVPAKVAADTRDARQPASKPDAGHAEAQASVNRNAPHP